METAPMPLDALSGLDAGLDEFRVSAPPEIAHLLKRLCDASALLNLNASDGSVYTSTIWTMDTARTTLGFNADVRDHALLELLECNEVVVVGYLDSIKLQFDVQDLVLVRGARASVLSCKFPRQMFRFQRRNSYRVRPLIRAEPTAYLPLRAANDSSRNGSATDLAPRGEVGLALRVLDVSIGGCALFVPDDGPALQPGALLRRVMIELDADTRFQADLQLHHVTAINATAHGTRLGCEFVQLSGDATRSLQRFIDLTQKRGRLMALD